MFWECKLLWWNPVVWIWDMWRKNKGHEKKVEQEVLTAGSTQVLPNFLWPQLSLALEIIIPKEY